MDEEDTVEEEDIVEEMDAPWGSDPQRDSSTVSEKSKLLTMSFAFTDVAGSVTRIWIAEKEDGPTPAFEADFVDVVDASGFVTEVLLSFSSNFDASLEHKPMFGSHSEFSELTAEPLKAFDALLTSSSSTSLSHSSYSTPPMMTEGTSDALTTGPFPSGEACLEIPWPRSYSGYSFPSMHMAGLSRPTSILPLR